jgi:hypothetical protein
MDKFMQEIKKLDGVGQVTPFTAFRYARLAKTHF